MLMLFPYNTDAPLYHFPIATIVMIVVNLLMFLTFCQDLDQATVREFESPNGERISVDELAQRLEENSDPTVEPLKFTELVPILEEASFGRHLMLSFGAGYRPWQWITNMFMHADWMHLIGNMVFLWAFGLVVEGKLGWLTFSIVYIGMGIIQSFLIQTIMLFADGGAALGASSAIFALLALTVVWAPRNCFDTLLLLGIRPLTIEMPILMFGFVYVAMNFFFWSMAGHSMGTEALHLSGFLVGMPVGFIMLLRGMVDCEGFDLISYWKGKEGVDSDLHQESIQDRKQANEKKSIAPTPSPQNIETLQNQVAQAIQEGNSDLAVALQRKLTKTHSKLGWKQPDLFSIIQSYLKSKEYAKAIPLMEEHIELFANHRFALQVHLIKLWLRAQRPRFALRYIEGMNPALLQPNEAEQLLPLVAHAKKMIKEGVLEVL